MKFQRQEKILRLIEEYEINTQEELAAKLQEAGFATTQATVSRDIKELRLVKKLSEDGVYRYAASVNSENGISSRLRAIFHECVTGLDYAQNIVVVKTLPGLANAACSAIDDMKIPHVVGNIAGDDTALLIMKEVSDAIEFCNEFGSVIK